MEKKITKDTVLVEILEIAGAEKILAKYKNLTSSEPCFLASLGNNLSCLWCPMARFEIQNLKIGQVCKMYNINIDKLLKELNEPL